jgi:peptidoglycan/LPS O-acetylase OafA/YrhL
MDNLRLTYLDSLRGLAATSVIASHFCISFKMPELGGYLLSNTLFSIIRNGAGAVSFFFVLSGFVLSLRYFTSSKKSSYLNYFIARFFRIYPLFIAGLLLSLFMKEFLFVKFNTIPFQDWYIYSNWQIPFNIKRLLTEGTLLFLEDPQFMLIPQEWTLRIELIISLFIPFLVLIARAYPKGFIVIVFCFMKFIGSSIFLFNFSLGIAIACNLNGIKILWTKPPIWFKYLFFLSGVILYSSDFLFTHNQSFLLNKLVFSVPSIGSAIIVIIALCSSLAQRLLNISFLQFMGKISYGIYLLHLIVLFCLTPLVMHFLNNAGLLNVYLIDIIAFLITVMTTYCISFLLYVLIEKPFIVWGKMLAVFISNYIFSLQNWFRNGWSLFNR